MPTSSASIATRRPARASSRRIEPPSISMLLSEKRGGGPGGDGGGAVEEILHARPAVAVASERDRRARELERVEHGRPMPDRRGRQVGLDRVDRRERRRVAEPGDRESLEREPQAERIERDRLERRAASERLGRAGLDLRAHDRRHREPGEHEERRQDAGADRTSAHPSAWRARARGFVAWLRSSELASVREAHGGETPFYRRRVENALDYSRRRTTTADRRQGVRVTITLMTCERS